MKVLFISYKFVKGFLAMFFSLAVFRRKQSRYCHHSGVVVGVGGSVVIDVVGVVKFFNLGYNFISVEANLMKLHMLVHHHKGYNLTDYRSVNSLC